MYLRCGCWILYPPYCWLLTYIHVQYLETVQCRHLVVAEWTVHFSTGPSYDLWPCHFCPYLPQFSGKALPEEDLRLSWECFSISFQRAWKWLTPDMTSADPGDPECFLWEWLLALEALKHRRLNGHMHWSGSNAIEHLGEAFITAAVCLQIWLICPASSWKWDISWCFKEKDETFFSLGREIWCKVTFNINFSVTPENLPSSTHLNINGLSSIIYSSCCQSMLKWSWRSSMWFINEAVLETRSGQERHWESQIPQLSFVYFFFFFFYLSSSNRNSMFVQRPECAYIQRIVLLL